jgi:hypothetical protein
MAVTITRTAWIDDDGTGTTGTVLNNAVKTSIYNEIDGALAKVAQLAGGNTFTGDQVCTGFVNVNIASSLNARVSVVEDGAVRNGISLQNNNGANTNMFYIVFYNAASALAGYIAQLSATTIAYATSSDQRLKDDQGRATDLAALRALVVHDFTWKADGIRDRGIFAQEAHALYPRAVVPGTDDCTDRGDLVRPWGTDYSKFVSDLIVGWQQHDADLAALRAQLATLKGSH